MTGDKSEKPKNILQYKEWLYETHKSTIDERYQSYYDSVVAKIKRDFFQHYQQQLALPCVYPPLNLTMAREFAK